MVVLFYGPYCKEFMNINDIKIRTYRTIRDDYDLRVDDDKFMMDIKEDFIETEFSCDWIIECPSCFEDIELGKQYVHSEYDISDFPLKDFIVMLGDDESIKHIGEKILKDFDNDSSKVLAKILHEKLV